MVNAVWAHWSGPLDQDGKDKLWALLHAETLAEIEALAAANAPAEAFTPDKIDQVKQMREQMRLRSQEAAKD